MILVTGATGNVGAEVVAALSGERVRALSRSPQEPPGPHVEVVAGDLNEPAELGPVFDGVEAVFLMAGYPDAPGLLARMKDRGVHRVVLLSTGAVAGGDVDNYVTRFNLVAEAAVRDSGLDWTVLRPSGFLANTLRWLPQLSEGDTVVEPFADVPVTSIDPADIGAVAALALTRNGHQERSYRLTGPEPLLPADRLNVLGEVIGRDLHLVAQSDDDARRDLAESMPAPLVDAFFRYFRGGEYDDGQVDPTLTHLLGRPARTCRDWTVAHQAQFR